jgi:hypothetical protein
MICGSCRGPLGDLATLCDLCRQLVSTKELAALVCEDRALSLAQRGQVVLANEAQKCAEAIRRAA